MQSHKLFCKKFLKTPLNKIFQIEHSDFENLDLKRISFFNEIDKLSWQEIAIFFSVDKNNDIGPKS